MKEKYNIDPGRIYMQGMSMGNAMTSQFARYMGDVLAGAAGSGCPTNTKLLFGQDGQPVNEGGPLDVWQSRLEHDQTPPHYSITILPFLRENRVWDYLFSGCYKDDKGQLKHIEPNRRREGDRFAIALSKDTGKAWFNNQIVEMEEKCFLWSKLKYHGLNGDAIVRGTYHYVPVSFLKKVFSVKTVETAADGLWAEMVLEDDTVIQIARGVKACVVNNCVEAMDCETVERDGMLCISQITMRCCRPIWRG